VKLLDEKHVVESDTIPAPLTAREAGRQFMQMYVSAFPDLHFDIDQIFGEGDFVATRGDRHVSGRVDGHQADESAHRDARLLSRSNQERQSCA